MEVNNTFDAAQHAQEPQSILFYSDIQSDILQFLQGQPLNVEVVGDLKHLRKKENELYRYAFVLVATQKIQEFLAIWKGIKNNSSKLVVLLASGDAINFNLSQIKNEHLLPLSTDIPLPHLYLMINALMSYDQKKLSMMQNLEQSLKTMQLFQAYKLSLQSIEEAEICSIMIAQSFTDPVKVFKGVRNLLLNSVEHGLLGIGYDLKKKLLEENKWHEEIQKRQSQNVSNSKSIVVYFERKDNREYLRITDPGQGFNWQDYVKFSSNKIGNKTVQGIAEASAVSFDRLSFNEQGNEVIAYRELDAPIQWQKVQE